MNKLLVLNWLLHDADEYADDLYGAIAESRKDISLQEALRELNNWRDINLPASLPKTPDKLIPALRKHFKDNITFISLVLNRYFPEEYFFYRVSALEEEIFEGFEFFSEVIPEFSVLNFRGVGRKGFDRYLRLNKALLEFASLVWPELELKKYQNRLAYLLYQGLGELFLERSDYNRYWLMATQERYFEHLDTGEDVEWSGRKEMQTGDLVFMYRMAPRKAIADVYWVKDEPYFDPWGEWGGFVVLMEKVCAIQDIPFAEMKTDHTLGKWGLVRRNFQGTVTEPMPYSMYNRLLDKIPAALRDEHGLEYEPVATMEGSGQFASEAEFEEDMIVPLLKHWELKYQAQHPCLFRVGSQYHSGKVDFLVSDAAGPLTLFEDKLRIINDRELKPAVDQAKSYALLLGLPSFVVASPEGMWLYSLAKNQERLVKQVPVSEFRDRQEEEFRELLVTLRA
jgi:hypothetical protein